MEKKSSREDEANYLHFSFGILGIFRGGGREGDEETDAEMNAVEKSRNACETFRGEG